MVGLQKEPKTINMKYLLLLFFFLAHLRPFCQDDLENLMSEMEKSEGLAQNFATSAYKSTHIINLQSTKLKSPGSLEFRIAHRFGPINGGFQQMYGLDQATIRLSLEYGVSNWLSVGFGRSTYEKTYDFHAKVSLLKQQTGKKQEEKKKETNSRTSPKSKENVHMHSRTDWKLLHADAFANLPLPSGISKVIVLIYGLKL